MENLSGAPKIVLLKSIYNHSSHCGFSAPNRVYRRNIYRLFNGSWKEGGQLQNIPCSLRSGPLRTIHFLESNAILSWYSVGELYQPVLATSIGSSSYKLLFYHDSNAFGSRESTGHFCVPFFKGVGCFWEYWMILRGPGILAVAWFGSSPTPSPLPVCELDRWHTGRLRKKEGQLADGRGGGVGWGAKSYYSKKAWPSINHSIISDGYYVLYIGETSSTSNTHIKSPILTMSHTEWQ